MCGIAGVLGISNATSHVKNMLEAMHHRGPDNWGIYEDKNTGYLSESSKLLQRNFDNRWVNPEVVQQQAAAAEQLRPKMDDIRLFYKNIPTADDSKKLNFNFNC